MKEEFLHFIWENQYFDKKSLLLNDGRTLEILHQGAKNTNAGADFTGVCLRIDGQIYAGDAEIHKAEQEWREHRHGENRAFDHVILHIVWSEKPDLHHNAAQIPVLSLSSRVPHALIEKYSALSEGNSAPSCSAFWVRDDVFEQARQAAFSLRTAEKISFYENKLNFLKNDWLAVAQWSVFKAMGMSLNEQAFEMLASALPYKILLKHADNPFQLEALFFGQAGMLQKTEDEYQANLQKEYRFLAQKYGLSPLEEKIWKFSKIRPAAFPSLKIAQLAALFSEMNFLNDLLRIKEVSYWKKRLQIALSPYWKNHYYFGKKNESGENTVGENSINYLIINGINYLQTAYSFFQSGNEHSELSANFLAKLPHEKNRISKLFSQYPQKNAFHSQAEIALHRYFCTPKQCLSCPVGMTILRESRPMYPEKNT
jgi:hypothetical protein